MSRVEVDRGQGSQGMGNGFEVQTKREIEGVNVSSGPQGQVDGEGDRSRGSSRVRHQGRRVESGLGYGEWVSAAMVDTWSRSCLGCDRLFDAPQWGFRF